MKTDKVQITIGQRLITALVNSANNNLSALLAIVNDALSQNDKAGYKSINGAIRAKTDCAYSTDSLQSLIKARKNNPGKPDDELLKIAKKAIEQKRADAAATRAKREAAKREAAAAAEAEAEAEAAAAAEAEASVEYWEAIIASCQAQISEAEAMIAQIKAAKKVA